MAWPGIAADRLAAGLSAATQGLEAVLAVTAEVGAVQVEPSHLLVLLARLPGGLARGLLRESEIPVDVLVEALRRETAGDPAGAEPMLLELAGAPMSQPARALTAGLSEGSGPIEERDLLAAVLTHLEPVARRLLQDFGGVDLAAWLARVTAGPVAPVVVFSADGRLAEAGFTPMARIVLEVLRTEAAAGGHRTWGTLLLLHAMAGAPRGLVEQAALFAGFDVRDVRTRTLLLLGRGGAGRGSVGPSVQDTTMSTSLRSVLGRAATAAVERGGDLVAERDLLDALLAVPDGSVETVLRSSGADPDRLRRFAATLYAEPTLADDGPSSGPTVAEAQENLRRALIGQPEVLARILPVVARIRRAVRRGFRMGDRPLGTFLFCGPSGTGKTMTARLLAEAVHGSPDALIVFEMGQFNSRESINNFIGAPPGYVGFGEGQLTNGLARTPRCVLLFDEVEKAHRLVLDALLRLLDEGRVNDPAGPVRDARDTVVVLTSNCGARQFAELARQRLRGRAAGGVDALGAALDRVLGSQRDAPGPVGDEGRDAAGGAADVRRELRAELEGFMRPELLNRVDETVLFTPFTSEDLTAIAAAGLARRACQVRDGLGVALRWDDDVPHQVVRAAVRDRVDEAARGVNRSVDVVLDLVLAALDDGDGADAGPASLRVVVTDDDELAVVAGG